MGGEIIFKKGMMKDVDFVIRRFQKAALGTVVQLGGKGGKRQRLEKKKTGDNGTRTMKTTKEFGRE